MINKACPVVLRTHEMGQLEMLAFKHPLAGKQWVKGSVEPSESVAVACERELLEESGLIGQAWRDLGPQFIRSHRLMYGFFLMQVDASIPDSFSHYCPDDGGHLFEFFWQPLAASLDEAWHPIFCEIHQVVCEKLANVTEKGTCRL